MALVKCKECGTEVSTKATACPKCGAPAPAGGVDAFIQAFDKMRFGTFLILSIFGIWAWNTLFPNEPSKASQMQYTRSPDLGTPHYVLTADQLYGDYSANEVAADAKYKGKIVSVHGVVQQIGKDILDDAYIVIGGRGLLDGVQCTFTKDNQFSVAYLNKGQTVTVKGEARGKMGNVTVNKCALQ